MGTEHLALTEYFELLTNEQIEQSDSLTVALFLLSSFKGAVPPEEYEMFEEQINRMVDSLKRSKELLAATIQAYNLLGDKPHATE